MNDSMDYVYALFYVSAILLLSLIVKFLDEHCHRKTYERVEYPCYVTSRNLRNRRQNNLMKGIITIYGQRRDLVEKAELLLMRRMLEDEDLGY